MSPPTIYDPVGANINKSSSSNSSQNGHNFAFTTSVWGNNSNNNNINKQTRSSNLSSASASVSFSNDGVGDVDGSYCDCVTSNSSIFSQRQHHHRVVRRRKNNNMNNKKSHNGNKNNNNIHDDYDTQLTKELNELSFEERNQVYEEVHGVAETIQETSEFLEKKLDELKVAISKLSRSKRRVLDRAFFLKPTLCEDEKFMLMFLRADYYDPTKAAQRMGKYFDNKLELWGESKLVKDITLQDLNDDDLDCLQSGTTQLLPTKDQSGRYVWFVAQTQYKYKHWKNQIRYTWYQVMATLENEDAQIQGIVDVVYCVGLSSMENQFPQMMTEGGHYLTDLPFRIVGLHLCYNDIRLRPALSLVQMICDRQKRLRIKFHYGSNIEVQYALLTFGIPVSVIPMNKDGSLIDEVTQKYIQERKDIEETRRLRIMMQQQQQSNNKNNNYIEYPNYYDILLGRGRPYQEFTGNQILMNLVETKRQHYQSLTDKFEKTCITMGIVNKIQNDFGGRFIQRIPNQGWEVVDDLVAREKVSHTFRTKTTKIHCHRGNNNNSIAAAISPILPLSTPSSSLSNNGLVAVGEQQQQQQRRRQQQQQQQQHTQDEDEVLNGGDYDSTLYRKNTKRIRI